MPTETNPANQPTDWNPISPLWAEKWRICVDLACREENRLSAEAMRACSAMFLRGLRTNWIRMRDLRNLLRTIAVSRPVNFMNDGEVIEAVGRLLRSGRIHLHAVARPRSGYPSRHGTGSSAEDSAPQSRPSGSSSSSAGSSLEPDTFDRNSDGAAMAEALKQAALAGTPFAQQC